MTHPSDEIQRNTLAEAAEVAPVGALFRHYKGNIYEVFDHIIDEETDEARIVYADIDKIDIKYGKKLGEWVLPVMVGSMERERFQRLDY